MYSEERSKLSIAAEYVAVFLGYLCLHTSICSTVERSKHGLGILIQAIRDFIKIHKHTGSKVHELENLVVQLDKQQ